jgi:hypothetical protein
MGDPEDIPPDYDHPLNDDDDDKSEPPREEAGEGPWPDFDKDMGQLSEDIEALGVSGEDEAPDDRAGSGEKQHWEEGKDERERDSIWSDYLQEHGGLGQDWSVGFEPPEEPSAPDDPTEDSMSSIWDVISERYNKEFGG